MTKSGQRLIAAAKEAAGILSREDQIQLMATARERHTALIAKFKADGTLRKMVEGAQGNAACDQRAVGKIFRVTVLDT